MSSNILTKIQTCCIHNKKKIMTLQVKQLSVIQAPVIQLSATLNTNTNTEPIKIKNKLISCYEEDYTRNANEIMKLWQRN
jgi:hypothetical protein